jgi:hypothetical protein
MIDTGMIHSLGYSRIGGWRTRRPTLDLKRKDTEGDDDEGNEILTPGEMCGPQFAPNLDRCRIYSHCILVCRMTRGMVLMILL